MEPDAVGSFALVLHSHIPYVLAHGRRPHGTDWLAEAVGESYIPLLDVFHRLIAEGISPRVTLSMTPILTEQLADTTFQAEFDAYLSGKIQSARDNQAQFGADGDMHRLGLAHYWEAFYSRVQRQYRDVYGRDIVGAFRDLQDAGHIEIITSAATHGYLPLLLTDQSVQAQVKQGVQTYQKHYGRAPRGFWLPECAYRPRYAWNPPVEKYQTTPPLPRKGVDEFLVENGLEYFFVDAHLLKGGKAIGVYADRFAGLQSLWSQFAKSYAPLVAERTPYTPYLVNSGGKPGPPIAVFSRDHKTGAQVWSGDTGYPGDFHYLEFHKKHYPGDLRYWRVSGDRSDLGGKSLYEPREALYRAQTHGAHFAQLVRDTLAEHKAASGAAGIITAMYDTELYGHWWFEGPEFLYHALKQIHADPSVTLTTCGDYLSASPPSVVVGLPEGSWGEGGYHWIWLNEWTAWTWEKIYQAEQEMAQLARDYVDMPSMRILLTQACRELLLLESSDWQFSISTWSSRDYAEQRVNYHHARFMQIAALIRRAGDTPDSIILEEWNALGEALDRDRCFADVDPAWWAAVDYPAT